MTSTTMTANTDCHKHQPQESASNTRAVLGTSALVLGFCVGCMYTLCLDIVMFVDIKEIRNKEYWLFGLTTAAPWLLINGVLLSLRSLVKALLNDNNQCNCQCNGSSEQHKEQVLALTTQRFFFGVLVIFPLHWMLIGIVSKEQDCLYQTRSLVLLLLYIVYACRGIRLLDDYNGDENDDETATEAEDDATLHNKQATNYVLMQEEEEELV